MSEANKPVGLVGPIQVLREEGSETAMKLVEKILAGKIADIKPQLDFATDLGFAYPSIEKTLKIPTKEALSTLVYLANKGILNKEFFDRLFRCPNCQSMNLRPSTHCPKCSSANILRGRVLEHFVCKYVGLEGEFASKGRYICPKCQQELRTIGSDYQSLGLLRKCQECGEVFSIPLIKWRCLKCSTLTAEEKIGEVNIYSYSLNEGKRNWVEFELQPKTRLIEFLKQYGYEVTENAKIRGRSGAEHDIDLLAVRDDGIITYNIAIGVELAGDEIGLGEIFDFDDKAYDSGIHDKILIVIPSLGNEAERFANQQRIKVLEVKDLETVLASGAPQLTKRIKEEPFKFKSKSQLMEHLKHHGYQLKENAEVKGRSGATHHLDILATRDDGIVTHHVAVGIEETKREVELNKVFSFDDKAYDTGILNKVFIAVPGLSPEAKQFAQRQNIRVFEAEKLESSG